MMEISYWLRAPERWIRGPLAHHGYLLQWHVVKQSSDPRTQNYSGPLVEVVAVGTSEEAARAAFCLLAEEGDVKRNRELGRLP